MMISTSAVYLLIEPQPMKLSLLFACAQKAPEAHCFENCVNAGYSAITASP